MGSSVYSDTEIKNAFRDAYNFMVKNNKLCVKAEDYTAVLKAARVECNKYKNSPEAILSKNLLFAVAVSIVDASA